MNFIEFVAFVFTMFVMFWVMIRKSQEAAPEQEPDIIEVVAPAKVQQQQQLPTYVQPVSTAYAGDYSLYKNPSRLKKAMNRLPSRKQLVILNEVLGPPKALE